MKKVFNTLVLLMFLIFVCSCKKDKDTTPPTISITLPTENTNFSVFDTIRVKATVTDDTKLSSITLKLLNESLTPVQNSVTSKPDSRSYSIDQLYLLYDVHLTSGIYYIGIFASDGTNVASAYRKISINEEPLKRTGFIFFEKPAYNTLNIVKIDSAYNVQPVLSNITSDYSASAVSSYSQQAYVAGKYSGSFKAVDLTNNTVKWNIPAVVSSSPYFTGVTSNGAVSYVSFRQGFVKAVDYNGSYKFTATIGTSGFYPELIFNSGENLLMEQIDATSTTKKIAVFDPSFGTGIKEVISNINVVAFCKKDANNIFVFGNDNSGQGVMKIYQISGNTLYDPHVLPTGKILSAAQIDVNTYVIGHSDGNLYQYTYSPNSITTLLSSVTPNKLIYDAVNNQLLVVESNDVKIYNYSTTLSSPAKTISSVDSIYNVEVLYNK